MWSVLHRYFFVLFHLQFCTQLNRESTPWIKMRLVCACLSDIWKNNTNLRLGILCFEGWEVCMASFIWIALQSQVSHLRGNYCFRITIWFWWKICNFDMEQDWSYLNWSALYLFPSIVKIALMTSGAWIKTILQPIWVTLIAEGN